MPNDAYAITMKMRLLVPAVLSALALALASFQSNSTLRAPYVVPPLTPPKGEVILFRAFADGVQIYECVAGGNGPMWAFKGPEADLTDDRSTPIGKHYAGPTWESYDGSKVVGETRARSDAADPNAIPWLLLDAKSKSGDGVLGQVTSIQRTQTVGGKAPAQPCNSTLAGNQVRVAYSAKYYFYEAKR